MNEFMRGTCSTCGEEVTQEDGALFLGDGGTLFCNDHYPYREGDE